MEAKLGVVLGDSVIDLPIQRVCMLGWGDSIPSCQYMFHSAQLVYLRTGSFSTGEGGILKNGDVKTTIGEKKIFGEGP
jgi:hypothetical protein